MLHDATCALPLDHGKNMRSMITTIWNSTTPMTDRMISAPKATGTLKKAVEVGSGSRGRRRR